MTDDKKLAEAYAKGVLAGKKMGRTKQMREALLYWRDECSGAEPSLSVFNRMVDAALKELGHTTAPESNRCESPPSDELEDKLARIRQWCEAYPVDIFPEIDSGEWKAIATILHDNHAPALDRIAASNMRHVLKGIAALLATPPQTLAKVK